MLAADIANVANNEVVFFTYDSDLYVYGAGADTTGNTDFMILFTGLAGSSFDLTAGALTLI